MVTAATTAADATWAHRQRVGSELRQRRHPHHHHCKIGRDAACGDSRGSRHTRSIDTSSGSGSGSGVLFLQGCIIKQQVSAAAAAAVGPRLVALLAAPQLPAGTGGVCTVRRGQRARRYLALVLMLALMLATGCAVGTMPPSRAAAAAAATAAADANGMDDISTAVGPAAARPHGGGEVGCGRWAWVGARMRY